MDHQRTGKLKLLLGMFCFLIFSMSSFAEVSLEASIDKNEGTMEDQFELEIRVTGIQNGPSPDLSSISNFEISSQGSSSNISIVNGETSISTTHSYVLAPLSPGNFKLGPFVISYKGKLIKSNIINVTVGKVARSGSVGDSNGENKDLFLELDLDKENPYQNEQVIMTISFYRSIRISDASLSKPKLDDFWSEPLGKENEFSKVINGKQYIVYQLKEALFPLKAGEIIIEPAAIKCAVQLKSKRRGGGFGFFDEDFFGISKTKSVIVRSKPIKLKVKSLPINERPSDFSGLVGVFRLEQRISKAECKAGESITITNEVRGDGNINIFKPFSLLVPPDFKVYEDKPVLKNSVTGDRIEGHAVMTTAIVPQNAGNFSLPQGVLVYFNPATGKYERSETVSVPLAVAPADSKEQLNLVQGVAVFPEKEAVKLIGKDILPNYVSFEGFQDIIILSDKPIGWIGVFFPFFIFLFSFIFIKKRESNVKNADQIRKSRARAVFNENLKLIRTNQSFNENISLLVRAIRFFIGDKFNISGGALTSGEVVNNLTKASFEPGFIEAFDKYFNRLEQLQYSKGEEVVLELEKLKREGIDFIKTIDKRIK